MKPKPIAYKQDLEKIWNEWDNENSKGIDSKRSLFLFDPNRISEKRLDSLLIPDKIRNNLIRYRKAGGKFNSADDFRKLYGMNDSIYTTISPYIKIEREIKLSRPIQENKKEIRIAGDFDPNKTNADELKKFGFTNFQSKNLLSYTENGGVFYAEKDLLKIYGIDSSFFSKIEKHIKIEITNKQEVIEDHQTKIIITELNSADSLQLVQLNGIGPTYAVRILKYRELLGGFYSKKQLLEVYNFPAETYQKIESAIEIDTLNLRKIRLNFADYKELLRHPYLNKTQVEAILLHRQQNGVFSNVSSIQDVEGVNEETFLRIAPYFTCR